MKNLNLFYSMKTLMALFTLTLLSLTSGCLLIIETEQGETTLSISPLEDYIFVNQTVTITTSGGNGLFSFEVSSGGGSISAEGVYTAGSSPGTATITVTSGSQSAEVTIYVADTLTLTPAVKAVIVGGTKQLTAAGGFAPYTYSVSGTGSVSVTGLYTSRPDYGKDVVTVTDSQGNTKTASLYTLTQMTVWLDASEVTGLADGAAMSQWDDISGNGNHATQAVGGNQPRWYNNNALSPNQQDCIQFTNMHFNLPEILNNSGATLITIGYMNEGGYFFADDAVGVGGNRLLTLGVADVSGVDRYAFTADDGTTSIVSSSSDNSAARVVAAQIRNKNISMSTDGTSSSATDAAYVIPSWETTGAFLTSGPAIGILGSGAFICEQIIYNAGNLAVANYQNLQCYMSEKYDLDTALTCP